MFEYLDFLFLSYSGRIGRRTYWLSHLVLLIAELLVVYGLIKLSGGTLAQLVARPETLSADILWHVRMPVLIIGALFLYPGYAIITKRWHDRGKSGWWSFIMLVPIIGSIWALVELGFLAGDGGSNSYGSR